MNTRRILATAIAVGALALTGCASDDLSTDGGQGDGDTVTVSGQNFPEAELVASMYTQLLENEGYTVDVKLVGTRDVYMVDFPKSIDVVPEYVGGIVDFLNKTQNGADAAPISTPDAQETIDAAQDLLDQQKITLLEPSEATDTNAFFVTRKYADAEGVSTLSDMKGKSVVLAAAPDCKDRPDCGVGLEDTYGINITKYLPLGFGTEQVFKSVLDGESQMGLTATTDGTLESQGLVLLEDDQKIQPSQHLVPAVSDAFLADHPDVEDPLNALMGALTTEKLTELNGKVAVEREKPEDVARQFLQDEGLL